MQTILDSFVQGTQQHPCQDSVHTDQHNLNSWVVLADGCSGTPVSEWGSRLLTRLFYPIGSVIPGDKPFDSLYNLISNVESMGYRLRLLPNTTLSTLLHSTLLTIVDDGVEFVCKVIGDGWIGWRDRATQVWSFETYHFTDNAPYYVGYCLPEPLIDGVLSIVGKQWQDQFPQNKLQITRYWGKSNNQTLTETETKIWDLRLCYPEPRYTAQICFPKDKTDMVMIGSDGLMSLMREGDGFLDFSCLIPQLTTLKQPSQGFVARRIHKLLSHFARGGVVPTDDISVAAIYCGE